MTNALINRPKEGGEWDVLRDTLCVHAMVDGFLVPVRPLGIFFLHSLINEPCPRISTHRYLSLKSLFALVGLPRGAADSELVSLIGCRQASRGNEDEEQADRLLTKNVVSRAARMTTYVPANAPRVFTEEEAAQIPEIAFEEHYDSEEEDPQEQHEVLSNQRSLDSIFQRIASEIVRKIPSTKEKRSWRKITDEEAYELRWDALCDATRLNDIMLGWHQFADGGAWEVAVDRLFPDLKTYTEKTKNGKKYMQNVSQCSWFQDYKEILLDESLTKKEKNALTRYARKKLREEAEWLPMTRADRMWGTGGDAVLHGERIGEHVPAVVLNPTPKNKTAPNADIPGGRWPDNDV